MDTAEQKNTPDIMTDIEQKMQKVVTAIYMVSDLIKKTDPIRQNMRFLSVKSLARVSGIAVSSPSKAQKEITEAQNLIGQLINLLKVSVSIGFVSDMNYRLITDTLVRVQDDLNTKYSLLEKGASASKNFHNRAVEEFVLPEDLFGQDVSKEHHKKTEKKPVMSYRKDDAKPSAQPKTQASATSSKKSREEEVVRVVSEAGEVSVSDVAEKFPEVSDKTIQRILVRLVDKGRLKKEGERRWSRYSLV